MGNETFTLFTRTKCKCGECPLRGQHQVKGIHEHQNDEFRVLFAGDAPEGEYRPFEEMVEKKLKDAVANAGLFWHMIHKTNVVSCRLGKNEYENEIARECCLPGFREELSWAFDHGLRVAMPFGQKAMEAMGLKGKLAKMRGSVFVKEDMEIVVVPTYAARWIVDGMWKEEPTWFGDFLKVRDLSVKQYKKPKEKFNLFPTLGEVKEFVVDAVKGKKLIGVDIETTGLNPYYAKILMVGLATDGETAMVVPFVKKGGEKYWTEKEFEKVKELLNSLFMGCPLMFQNAMFDVNHLLTQGFKIGKVKHDVMLLHHVINPELPHNLGYIVSIYGQTSYWKDVVLGNEERMINMEDGEVRTYNARDAVVLHQVLGPLVKHAKEVDTLKVYEKVSMPLVMPLLKMTMKGLPLEQKRIGAKRKKFKMLSTKARNKCYAMGELPEEFNLNSTDQLRYLFWGIKPKSYEKAILELGEYERKEGKPKNKNTKKYRELVGIKELVEGIVPFVQVVGRIPRTDLGVDGALDDEAKGTLTKSCIRRIKALDGLVKENEKQGVERKEIEKILGFVCEFKKYLKAEKLESTFTGFPVGPDGRVHAQYKIHGTTTGRLSSSKPNAQNIPEEVQDVFKAPEGRVILKADYSNIEYRMMALVTGETWLIEEFRKGVNFHDINTKLLFGIEKGDPMWDIYRRVAKVFAFGLFYGSGIESMYSGIIQDIPEFRFTLAQFKEIVKSYLGKMPKYAEWAENQKQIANKTRCVETIFGRKRFLLGMQGEIERQALNTPIQGSAGEVTERAIIELFEIFEGKEYEVFMISTIHDSILVEAPKEKTKEVALIMKEVMEKEYVIKGVKTFFPVDIEVGESWGETEALVW